MKYAVLFCAVVATTLLAGETAFGCNYVQKQAVVVQQVQVYSAPQAVIVQPQYVQAFAVQKQFVQAKGYGGQGFRSQRFSSRQNLDVGGGLGGIVNRQNILSGVGAAAGAALFGPLGAAGGAVLGNIIGGGN